MDHGPLSHLHLPSDLRELRAEDPRVDVLLARYDELPAARLAELRAHPALGAHLARLEAAEAWLGRGLAARRAREAAAPPAEDLYEFGAGPGARGPAALPPARRRAVEAHLAAAPEEARWVRSLPRRPTPPLLVDGAGADVDLAGEVAALEEEPLAGAPVGPRSLTDAGPFTAWRRGPMHHRVMRWAPLAAATLVLALGVHAVRQNRDAYQLDLGPLVRGALDDALAFPRGRVLAAPAGARGLFAAEPRFEFRAVQGATGYRVALRRHSGGAFELGAPVWSSGSVALDGGGPSVTGPALEPGHYTWEVFATVDGLERSQGTLEFHVVEDPGTLARLSHEPLLGQVRSLLSEGLVTDARHRARALPAGPERERLVGNAPAR